MSLSGGLSQSVGDPDVFTVDCVAVGASAAAGVIIQAKDDPRYTDISFIAHVSPVPLAAGDYEQVSDADVDVTWPGRGTWDARFHHAAEPDFGSIWRLVLDSVSPDGREIHGSARATLQYTDIVNGKLVPYPDLPEVDMVATF